MSFPIVTSQGLVSRVDLRNIAGALYFVLLALYVGSKFEETGRIFFVLLAFRFLVVGWFTLVRKPAVKHGPSWQTLLAYATVLVPLAYCMPAAGHLSVRMILTAELLSIAGYLLAAFAIIELGSQFGVSPAFRGEVCKSGVYRWFRHPMYVGYGIAELGWVLINVGNASIFILSMACQFTRAHLEEKLIRGHEEGATVQGRCPEGCAAP